MTLAFDSLSQAAPLLAAVEWGGAFELPPVGELFNFSGIELSVFGLNIAINRIVVLTFAAAIFAGGFLALAFGNPSIVPRKFQAAGEAIYTFFREQIVLEIIGPDGLRFLPLLLSMGLFIFVGNFFEVLPFVNFPVTSAMAIPAMLAAISWVVFIVVGFQSQGLGYLREIAFPRGVPKLLYILLTPIELLQVFVIRPITLALRLFANMVAGHLLLTIVFIATHAFLYFEWPGVLVGVLTLGLAPVAVGFEIFIGALQAYIFVLLTAVYISGSLHPEH